MGRAWEEGRAWCGPEGVAGLEAADAGLQLPSLFFLRGCARASASAAPHSRVPSVGQVDPIAAPSFPEPLFRSLSRCSAIETWPHGLGRRRPRSVFLSVCAPVFCVMLYVEWLLAEKQGRIFLSLSTSAVCSSAFQRERWSAYLNC